MLQLSCCTGSQTLRGQRQIPANKNVSIKHYQSYSHVYPGMQKLVLHAMRACVDSQIVSIHLADSGDGFRYQHRQSTCTAAQSTAEAGAEAQQGPSCSLGPRA